MRVFRWLTCIPAALAGYIVGYLAGAFIYEVGEWTCPSEYVVSGMCAAPWSQSLFTVALAIGASVAASLIVILPAMVAPSNRLAVAGITFVLGSLFAAYAMFSVGSSILVPGVTAITVGAVSLLCIRTRWMRFNSSMDWDAQARRSSRR